MSALLLSEQKLFLLVATLILVVILLVILLIIYVRKIKRGESLTEKNIDEKNRALLASRRLNKIILESLDFQDVIQKIADTIPNELYFGTGVVAVINESGRKIKRVAASRTKEATEAIKALPVPFHQIEISLDDPNNLMARSIRENKSFLTENVYDVLGPVLTQDQADIIQKIMGTKTTLVYPIYGSKGKAIGVFVASTKERKEEISEYEHDMIRDFMDGVGIAMEHALLYSRLKSVLEELQSANERLQEIDRLKDEFVSLASHELRTPMTIIKSYLWFLIEGKKGGLNDEQRQYVEKAYMSTERLINLVNDMLSVSRIESGRLTVHVKPINIIELIEKIDTGLQPRVSELKLNLIFNKPQEIPMVLADPERVEQVLINLIGNALKFTPEGGTITVSIKKEDETVVTSVSDTGRGIKAEDVSKLFKKFGMVGDENFLTRQATQGTGLGLYISKSIIELMKGKISVYSEGEGKGTTFSFSLPIAAPSEISEQSQEAPQG